MGGMGTKLTFCPASGAIVGMQASMQPRASSLEAVLSSRLYIPQWWMAKGTGVHNSVPGYSALCFRTRLYAWAYVGPQ